MKSIVLLSFLILAQYAFAEIPEWYKRDIAGHLEKADAVIVYRVKNVTFKSKEGLRYSYRIDTETINAIKGTPPQAECYFIHTEGEWASPYQVGEEAIVILNFNYTVECGVIEPGYGAPATKEYISLLNSIVQ